MERVPRYTSYPTAPHFHEGITFEQYVHWLEMLDKTSSLSLYVHIPYCRQLCWFCGCHTKVVNHYEPVERYLKLLELEISLAAEHINDSSVQQIHFGGGSPTVLEAKDFLRLMELMHRRFAISAHADIDIEIDPRSVDVEKIAAYAEAGVTRASIGVQDFNHKVQETINRVQPYDLVEYIVGRLRKSGIEALNLDLIYGLPDQTLETISESIALTLQLAPNRVSLFGYAHVPWMKKHQQLIPEDALPEKDARMAMFERASEMLQDAGYVAIGLDHFVRPDDSMALLAEQGGLQRNFQGYTTDNADALLGFGASAISSLPHGYAQNLSGTIEYAQAVKSGELPVARGVALTEEDVRRREIIMSLMSHLSAHVARGQYAEELARLAPYFDAGDVSYEDEVLQIKPKARNRLRLIASVFDAYLQHTQHRYSQAV